MIGEDLVSDVVWLSTLAVVLYLVWNNNDKSNNHQVGQKRPIDNDERPSKRQKIEENLVQNEQYNCN